MSHFLTVRFPGKQRNEYGAPAAFFKVADPAAGRILLTLFREDCGAEGPKGPGLVFDLVAAEGLLRAQAVRFDTTVRQVKETCEQAYSFTDGPRFFDGLYEDLARLYDRAKNWQAEMPEGEQAAPIPKAAPASEGDTRESPPTGDATLISEESENVRTEGPIFIGHGQSSVWKDLKDLLVDRLGLKYEEFNREPAAGVSNKERLLEMLDRCCFAFLVMTAEDEAPDGTKRARQNVIHEAGLFQGRYGFERATILLEEGCQEFSNIHGLGQIRFPKGTIMAVSEEIRRVLEREGILNKP
ncbi:MAG: nucleotide-binding protein [Planctomycetota bacterium]|nr:nucleotide-binding protein [Planctomycetota bacterium]